MAVETKREFDPSIGYLFFFQGASFSPVKGKVPYTEEEANEHNAILDKAMVAGMASAQPGQGGYFYWNRKTKEITTFIGTVVGTVWKVSGNVMLTVYVRGVNTNIGSWVGKFHSRHDGDDIYLKRVS